ncbi:MAG: hypothetical protein K5893_01935 [Prevotella sp.]|nr:hypothetical protein [Prevotella sp.]
MTKKKARFFRFPFILFSFVVNARDATPEKGCGAMGREYWRFSKAKAPRWMSKSGEMDEQMRRNSQSIAI